MRNLWRGLVCLTVGGVMIVQFFQPSRFRPAPSNTGYDLLADPKLPPKVHEILERSCVDCHSDRAHLPWYGHVSPVSWYLSNHIERGRKKLDFSDWPRNDYDLRQNIADSIEDRSMPLHSYCWIHRSAALSSVDIKLLEAWTDTP